MKKLTMLLVAAVAAATVATGALAGAPPPPTTPEDSPCRLKTSLGVITYAHMSTIKVIGSDAKEHTYLCYDGHWYEVKAFTMPTATFVGSFSTVLTRV